MSEAYPDWSADSNNAVQISLEVPGVGGPKALHTFHPKFTYPIFGDEERIFGYQGLKINLRYNAPDMRPNLRITYTKKFKAVGDTEPTDLKNIFEEFLPKTAFEKSAVFDEAISNSSYATWKPPGELWQTVNSGDKIFEVWKGSLADPSVKQLIKRIQILVPLFIEGGTVIELDEEDWVLERWTVFFLFEKKSAAYMESTTTSETLSPYTFVGYSTVYRFYFIQSQLTPPSTPPAKRGPLAREPSSNFDVSSLDYSFSLQPCRSRISQFVILPPFHGGGNGSRFYNSIFDYYLQEPQTLEITVEDPNEAFDDLRDLNDLARLRKASPEFAAIRINSKVVPRADGVVPRDIVDKKVLQKIRKDFKIAPRQFSRLVEMHILSSLHPEVRQSIFEEPSSKKSSLKAERHEYHLWQLLTKQRLYRHNKDSLVQLDRAERIEKLDDALGNVEADYSRLLSTLEERQNGKGKGKANGSNGSLNGKRPSPFDVEEEEGEPSAKKIKFA